MRICFISLENIRHVPYLYKYVSLTDADYDIIYWNRRGIEEDCGAKKHYAFNCGISEVASKWEKMLGYFKFRKYASEILLQNDYDRLILLTGNVAVLLKNSLIPKYKDKYIIDIRDYFMEHNKLYYFREKRVIENSGIAVISSEDFKKFLPDYTYIIAHNTPNITNEQISLFRERKSRQKKTEGPITLSFIGGVRFFEQDKKILNVFSNDERFFVRYIGVGASLLEEHCRQNSIKNVYLHDQFPSEQTMDFYVDTDMILNLYGSGTPLLDHALSNKLYYAVFLGLPILVCTDTYMERVCVGGGFGFALDLDDPAAKDRLFQYYTDLDRDLFLDSCERYIKSIKGDEAYFSTEISRFINID